ncbi:hypothetical protein CDD81_6879 [Ophiocordyceps australis]|uniref:WW domain-containing protein n=1 Tax=Ophiocordyceps australis TaxID=1399860 RepID=A0A2C5Y6G9_9HYPO|nr:hypothetical protein CDD81_6879 [Ophiocordyceps australis]
MTPRAANHSAAADHSAAAASSPSPAQSPASCAQSGSPRGSPKQDDAALGLTGDDAASSGQLSDSSSDGEQQGAATRRQQASDKGRARPAPGPPPLPDEPIPGLADDDDDGWTAQWDQATNNWYFYNRVTGQSQWDNPRVPQASASTAPAQPDAANPKRAPAGGYNPAIHGDYDPNAWYAQAYNDGQQEQTSTAIAQADPATAYSSTVGFNRFNGHFQTADAGPARYSDEAKARRQLNAFFDVDAAANAHNGRSLKAERQNQRLSKSELKAYKEKRRAKKEEKRRAWLRD